MAKGEGWVTTEKPRHVLRRKAEFLSRHFPPAGITQVELKGLAAVQPLLSLKAPLAPFDEFSFHLHYTEIWVAAIIEVRGNIPARGSPAGAVEGVGPRVSGFGAIQPREVARISKKKMPRSPR